MNDAFTLSLLLAAIIIWFAMSLVLARRYKRCPSHRVLVVTGKVPSGRSAVFRHGGGTFVWPLIQDFAYLSLEPMRVQLAIRDAVTKDGAKVDLRSVFTVAIATDPESLEQASVRLLGLSPPEIESLAETILAGRLRETIGSVRGEDIATDWADFGRHVRDSAGPVLSRIGLTLIDLDLAELRVRT